VEVADVVESLHGDAAGEGGVAEEGDDVLVGAALVAAAAMRGRRRGRCRRGRRRSSRIAFLAHEEAGEAAGLADFF